MLSTESWPQPAIRLWIVAQRFQKFLLVGAVGLAVNQAMLFALHGMASVSERVASPIAIFVSMVVTFLLNEHWTWHDRGTGKIAHRVMFYFPINSGGLVINYVIFILLVDHTELHYLMANLVGAGFAAIWNFSLNHKITWRR
jgi:putative flippase GtrA